MYNFSYVPNQSRFFQRIPNPLISPLKIDIILIAFFCTFFSSFAMFLNSYHWNCIQYLRYKHTIDLYKAMTVLTFLFSNFFFLIICDVKFVLFITAAHEIDKIHFDFQNPFPGYLQTLQFPSVHLRNQHSLC